MRIKLALLYAMMAIVLSIGVYAAIQCIPEPNQAEEDPYEYDQLLPQVTVPSPDASKEHDSSPDSSAPTQPVQPDLDALAARNEDFVGWLSIDGTGIGLPVVQGEDNSYYLNHAFSKSRSAYGCPFLDTRTPPDGDCLVIHGHNMGYNRTEIFSPLIYFQDPTYASQHSILRLSRPDRAGEEYELFAVVNVDLNDVSMDYIQSAFDTKEDRAAFLSKLQEKSLYPSNSIPAEGQILILSTCNRRYGADNRLLIVAVNRISDATK